MQWPVGAARCPPPGGRPVLSRPTGVPRLWGRRGVPGVPEAARAWAQEGGRDVQALASPPPPPPPALPGQIVLCPAPTSHPVEGQREDPPAGSRSQVSMHLSFAGCVLMQEKKYSYMCARVCTYMHVCAHMSMRAHVHVCVCMCAHMYCACVCMRALHARGWIDSWV